MTVLKPVTVHQLPRSGIMRLNSEGRCEEWRDRQKLFSAHNGTSGAQKLDSEAKLEKKLRDSSEQLGDFSRVMTYGMNNEERLGELQRSY